MARFRFSLEQLLKLRGIEEDRAKNSFLLQMKGFRLKEAEAQALTAQREEAKQRTRESAQGILDIEEVLRSRRHINFLYQRLAEIRVHLEKMRPAIDEARGAFRKAARKRQALERIRERRWKEHLLDEGRKDQRILDDVAQIGFVRARMEEALETVGAPSIPPAERTDSVSNNRPAAVLRRPSGAEEGEAAVGEGPPPQPKIPCGRRGGGSASPAIKEAQSRSNSCSGSGQ